MSMMIFYHYGAVCPSLYIRQLHLVVSGILVLTTVIMSGEQ